MPDEVTTLLAIVNGEALSTPPTREWPQLFAVAREHGLLPVLNDAAIALKLDDEMIAAMRADIAGEHALALVRERELRLVVDRAANDGIVPLIIKGAHLAYAVYPSPDRRPRVDADILIDERDRERLAACLTSVGYEPVPHVTGDVAFTQRSYWRADASGARHSLDVHWRITIPKAFADRLTYAELRRNSMAIPQLGSHALGPSLAHALIIGCVHRTAHHAGDVRFVWLYDLHLIAARLTDVDWQAVVDLAVERGLAAVLVSGLTAAQAAFHTAVPERALARLTAHVDDADPDVLTFVRGVPTRIGVALSDWQRVRGGRARIRFLREHLFPSRAYMQHRYGVSSRVALPVLYGHRFVAGAAKWAREALANASGGRPLVHDHRREDRG
jgi:hypothetical protein